MTCLGPAGGAGGTVYLVLVLLLLAGVLAPAFVTAWVDFGPDFGQELKQWLVGREPADAEPGTGELLASARQQLVKQMLSPLLLPALGMLLVGVHRGLDLSVWMTFYLGAALAAGVTRGHGHPLAALGAVTAAGLTIGCVNAFLSGRLHLPVWLATLATATASASAVIALTGGGPLRVEPDRLARWSGASRPMAMVLTFYATGMFATFALARDRQAAGSPARGRGVALLASGMLSALGGLCWLVKSGEAPSPGWVVGDLRVAAGAVLAGGAMLSGWRRAALGGLLLPGAMLTATVWRQMVWDVPTVPLAVNVLLLILMVLVAHWLALRAAQSGAWLWPVLAAGGIAALAATAWYLPPPVSACARPLGVVLWAGGLVGGTVPALLGRRAPADG